MLDLGLGYGAVFSIMGMCHVTAFVVILLTIRRIEPVTAATATVPGARLRATRFGEAGSPALHDDHEGHEEHEVRNEKP
jgi:hypothetical protein